MCVCIFFVFSAYGKIGLKWYEKGKRGFVPTNPDLADILGDMDFYFENITFLIFVGFQIPRFSGPQISKFPDSQISRSPDLQISRLPDFQTPAAPPADKLSDPNLTPLPTSPRDQICRKEPLSRPQTGGSGFKSLGELVLHEGGTLSRVTLTDLISSL